MNSKRIVVNGHVVPPGGLSNIYAPSKMYKENGSEVNTADMIEALYKALVVDKNAGVESKLTGSNGAKLNINPDGSINVSGVTLTASDVKISGSAVKFTNQSIKTSNSSISRAIGNGTDLVYATASSGNGFVPFDISNVKKYIVKIQNTSALQVDNLRLFFSDSLAAANVQNFHAKYFFDLETPTLAAGATMFLNSEELPKMRTPFVGLGIRYRVFEAAGADLAAPVIFDVWGYK
jgi:hypothetical protein